MLGVGETTSLISTLPWVFSSLTAADLRCWLGSKVIAEAWVLGSCTWKFALVTPFGSDKLVGGGEVCRTIESSRACSFTSVSSPSKSSSCSWGKVFSLAGDGKTPKREGL